MNDVTRVGDVQSPSGVTLSAAPGGGAGGAPTGAQYIVGATHADLSAERVVTDTSTVTWDLATAGQAKANAVGIPTKGTATIDFGAFPGSLQTSVAVTGQASIVSGSVIHASIRPAATADHTADEHLVDPIRIEVGDIVAATGFTIHAFAAEVVTEPDVRPHTGEAWNVLSATTVTARGLVPGRLRDLGGKTPMRFGQWTVGWSWN